MAQYLVGDIQGCHSALQTLLQTLDFSPSRDQIYVLGDMVNRGEDSKAVLETLMHLGESVRCVLGNHDLHLLALAQGIRPAHPSDTLAAILDAPSRPAMLDWLRQQSLALHIVHQKRDWLLVHAGVLPQWSLNQTLKLAAEVQAQLQGSNLVEFLQHMYGNLPCQWHDVLQGNDRYRVIVNALTRMRFCDAQGQMEFDTKEGVGNAPAGFMPWFEAPNRPTAQENITIAFGHWSALGLFAKPDLITPNLLGLDTGCVWGGTLTAYEMGTGRIATTPSSLR